MLSEFKIGQTDLAEYNTPITIRGNDNQCLFLAIVGHLPNLKLTYSQRLKRSFQLYRTFVSLSQRVVHQQATNPKDMQTP